MATDVSKQIQKATRREFTRFSSRILKGGKRQTTSSSGMLIDNPHRAGVLLMLSSSSP
jgi:hypothetical protein